MKTKMLNKTPELYSFLKLNNSIDILNESLSGTLELWINCLFFQPKGRKGKMEKKGKTEHHCSAAALKSWLVTSHTGLQTFYSSCCLRVNWLCRSRTVCVGEVIIRVLAKENLAGTTAVVTPLRAELKIATKRKRPMHGDWILEVM